VRPLATLIMHQMQLPDQRFTPQSVSTQNLASMSSLAKEQAVVLTVLSTQK